MKPSKNILIKLSGASLKNEDNIICFKKLDQISSQIKALKGQYGIGIVLGGGNIWRGATNEKMGINRLDADSIGMLATIMNSISLKSSLNINGMKAKVYSALNVPRITNDHDANNFNEDIKNGEIVIFAGGIGMPYFSTDTCAALRCLEINSKIVLMGKNGTDGIYDKDPNKNKDAKFISSITYDEIFSKELKVADLTFITMCKENDIETIIFDIDKKESILNALNNKGKFTIIKNK